MVEQGAEQNVLQTQEEESQKSLMERWRKVAEKRKRTEVDWEGTTVNGLGTWEGQQYSPCFLVKTTFSQKHG